MVLPKFEKRTAKALNSEFARPRESAALSPSRSMPSADSPNTTLTALMDSCRSTAASIDEDTKSPTAAAAAPATNTLAVVAKPDIRLPSLSVAVAAAPWLFAMFPVAVAA